ncbi:MAG: FAD-dependent oxidoreductase [Promethearchaeota archaeon]
MNQIIEPEKKIDVIDEVDVIIVGAGPAGIGAAIASGRTGAKTILIERFGSVGGLQTQGNNPIFSFVDPELHGGIIQEILTGLKEGGGLKNLDDVPPNERSRFKSRLLRVVGAENLPRRLVDTEVGYWGVWGNTFDLEYYKFFIENMLVDAGVKILYHVFATDVIREENLLKGIIIESKEGRKAILGKVIIDCTGEGDIVWKSGATCMGDDGMPVGRNKGSPGGKLNAFFIGGVDIDKFEEFRRNNIKEWGQMYAGRKLIQKAKQEGAYIRGEAVVLSQLHDVYNAGRIYVMNAIHIVPKNLKSWMAEEMSVCEVDLRKQVWAVFKMLKENVPGFENSYIEKTPNIPCVGISHRIMGEYVLTVGDMREGKAFEDSIAINNMPPDLYEAVGRFSYEILPHDIPYRCLISKNIENLMAAGTTMSSGGLAVSGLRYCTPSICQGQAAGTAAALAAKNNISPKKLDIKLLQDTLREQGVRVTVKDLSGDVIAPYKAIKEMKIVFKRGDVSEMGATEEEIAKH